MRARIVRKFFSIVSSAISVSFMFFSSRVLTAQSLQALIYVLDLSNLDFADVCHKIGNVASVIADLLVDVMVAKNLIDFKMLAVRISKTAACL